MNSLQKKIKIELAKKSDIDEIFQLYEACKKHMIRNKIFQWNEHYPKKENVERDISNKDLYKIISENIMGVVALNDLQDVVYNTVDWKYNHANILVIHRLAVHPDYQGKGIAARLMDFSEHYGNENGYQSIRLDAFTENPNALKMYTKRNYEIRGTVYFPYRDIPFYCFEKLLV